MNADLDALLDTALELGLPDHVVVSLARVVNLMWLQERRSVVLPAANLMAYLGIESRNTLNAHLDAYARVPGLTVKRASGHVFIHYRPPRNDRAMDAQRPPSPDRAAERMAMTAQSAPNERAVSAQSGRGGAGDAQSAPNERAMGAQPTRNERAIGGGYRGGLARALAVTEIDVINLFGLNSARVSKRAERGGGSVRGEGETVSANAQSPRNERTTGAQSPRNERAMGAQSSPNVRTVVAQSARGRRAMSAQSVVDGATVDAFLNALTKLGGGRPVFGGRELSRADVRSVLEVAIRQGYSLDLVLAEAMALEEEFRRKGKDMGSPVALLRHWVARPDLAERVPSSLHQTAREILGLEPEEDEDEDDVDERVEVKIVGDPPYDPREVWEKARARLRDELSRRDFNTWLRDTVLLGWREGEFVLGAPNAFAKDWLRNRLDGQVKAALRAVLGGGDVDVGYAVRPRTSEKVVPKDARKYIGGPYGSLIQH